MLPAQQWTAVKSIFERARHLSTSARAELLDAHNLDPVVRDEVLSLLAADEESDELLDSQPEATLLPAGTRIGPYQITSHLGGGGMGDVYRALDSRLAREVALKVLRGPAADGHDQLFKEARALAALSHPSVVAIHDVGVSEGLCYLVTELLEGETLRARLARGRVPTDEAIRWVGQIALALAAAHDAGVVHRDLKPENVFLLADGNLKVLDFGLARLLPGSRAVPPRRPVSSPGLLIGTAGYMAPEQLLGEPATPTADLFALGAILFELLTATRAFRGDTRIDTLLEVMERDPPAPSTLNAGIPLWLDRVVARLLAKSPTARFQSARDLAFVLASPSAVRDEAPATGRRTSGGSLLLVAGVLAVLVGIAVPLWSLRAPKTPSRAGVPRSVPLTYSGRDQEPAVSPDGRFLAYASDRDGSSRIWLQQLEVGRETPLTEGPDTGPRFSPDGSRVLFTRTRANRPALYRVAILGGAALRLVDDASDGDWSPDGRQLAFVRWHDAATQARPTLMLAQADGNEPRELAQLGNRIRLVPRWSPDGKTIAVTGLSQQPGAPQNIVLVPTDGSPPRTIEAANGLGLVSSVTWDGDDHVLYSQAISVTGNSAGSAARLVRHPLGQGIATTLLWSPESSLVIDRWPGRGLVFDARSSRQNLRLVTPAPGTDVVLSRGTATDRQPLFSRDGHDVIFSSNRGDNLDLWTVSLLSGTTRRLTDHPADDWDPALTTDGAHLLWSSNRSGNFEIWMAEADGGSPHRVTSDGVDAENPSATPDGAWIVYASGAPGRAGVFRVRPDGGRPELLVKDGILPEVSPDGRYVLFQSNRSPHLAVVRVASLEHGSLVPFEIQVEVRRRTPAVLGRAHWSPDGGSIAFLGQDQEGRTGVFLQRFLPGEDTSWSRQPLGGFAAEVVAESFGLAPDGRRVVMAEWEQRSQIMGASGLLQ